MPLTAAEKQLAVAIGFDESICEIVKDETGGSLGRLVSVTEEYEIADANGLSIEVERQDVEAILDKLQPRLVPRGYRAFWSEVCEGNGLKRSEEIAVLKATDHYSIVRIRRTDGANYGLSTDDVITRLKEWENRCQLEIVGAGGAWIAIQFETLSRGYLCFRRGNLRFLSGYRRTGRWSYGRK